MTQWMNRRTPALAVVLLIAMLAWQGPASGDEQDGEYPVGGLQPKVETGADRFLAAHPEYDGRGVVVAIFDTGVDPGAPGLQTTSDGKPKIVDIIDGTGSGDVDTSKVVKAKDGKLAGLSGRALTLDPAWKNPSGEWRVGLKAMAELFPGELVSRMVKERQKAYLARQRVAVTTLEAEVAAKRADHDADDSAQVEDLKDLEARLDVLRSVGDRAPDPGPIVDCVVWNDGTHWWAVIDSDEDGDLTNEKAMRRYRINRDFATFDKISLMNFCLNVHNDGDRLSIVADAGDHGTHVAGIVAAHFPDKPEMNGIAPGAQIVAVKIGDSRMRSSSFGTGPERGVGAVLRNKCDLINMSYGGASRRANVGRVADLYREVVNKHGVIFVASAGNEGPALTTVGSPGGTTDALIGVGAYVSPAMMKAQMGVLDDLPGTHFTWSSRGPTHDGDLGVDISAPGGAVAPVPNWSLQGTTQMNGTSMSSPNACGVIALLLSGMKDQGIKISPDRIRRAIVNTAAPIPGVGVWAAGHGMIQADAAWDYLVSNKDRSTEDVRFEVTLPRRDNARGVYLREPHEVDRVLQTSVRVKPQLHEDADNTKRVDLQLRLALECTQPWIDAADHVQLSHGASWFQFRVDPTKLPEGAHYGEIRAYDVEARERGPMFRVPVTVIRPKRMDASNDHTWTETIRFTPGEVQRRFFSVPAGATWADLTVKAAEAPTDKLLVIEATQIAPGRSYSETHREVYARLRAGEVEGYSISVAHSRTLELALAQYWRSLGEASYEFELTFHGITASPSTLALVPGATAARVEAHAPFRGEDLSPSGRLDALHKALRATKAEIRPLTKARDGLPREQVAHEAVLTYAFEVDDRVNARFGVRLDDEEGGWEAFSSMLWQLFDAGGQLVSNGHAGGSKVSLRKGSYTVRFHMRHPDVKMLERARNAVGFLAIELDSPIALSFHAWGDDAFLGRGKVGDIELRAGERRALFIPGVPWGDLPDAAEPGDVLHGRFHLGKSSSNEKGAGRRPGGYAVRYTIPPEPVDYEEDESVEPADDRDALQKARDAVRDGLVSQLAGLRKGKEADAFKKLHREAVKAYPRHLDLKREWLRFVLGDGPPYKDKARAARVRRAVKEVLGALDRDEIAKALGVKYDATKPEDLRTKKEADKQRAALVEALHADARVLVSQLPGSKAEFEKVYTELRRFQDVGKGAYVWLTYELELSHEHYGKALEILGTQIKAAPQKKKAYKKRLALFTKLGWSHLVERESSWMLRRFPPAGFPPF